MDDKDRCRDDYVFRDKESWDSDALILVIMKSPIFCLQNEH